MCWRSCWRWCCFYWQYMVLSRRISSMYCLYILEKLDQNRQISQNRITVPIMVVKLKRLNFNQSLTITCNIQKQKKILISMGSFVSNQNHCTQPAVIQHTASQTLHSSQSDKCQDRADDQTMENVRTIVDDNEMCEKILQNNKKLSLNRRNSRNSKQSTSSLVTMPEKENKNTEQGQQLRQLNPKLKYFENNKKLVQSSIEATICVEKVLSLLCHREILQKHEFNYLNAKNRRSLECKQKRYRNLEQREQKAMLSLAPIDNNKISRQSFSEKNSVYAKRHRQKRSVLALSQEFS